MRRAVACRIASDRIIDRLLTVLDRRRAEDQAVLAAQLGRIEQRLAALEHRLAQPPEAPADDEAPPDDEASADDGAPADELRLRNVLWAIAAEEPRARRQLWTMRAHPEYELAFTDINPLVSVVIATRERPQLLAGRAVPSVLAQTHRNVEVVVVGDAAGPATADALAAIGDPRVRFRDLPHRVVAGADPARHALVAATLPRNEGTRMARGRWLIALDDDGALDPDAVTTLLELARERRAEVAYGRAHDGRSTDPGARGTFPPHPAQFTWQAALTHGGLRLFDRQFAAADFGMTGDAWLLERMLRAGVRMAMTEAVVCDLS